MPKKPNLAEVALETSFRNAPNTTGVNSKLASHIIDDLLKFRLAVLRKRPDAQFSTLDIANWAKTLNDIAKFETERVDETLCNTYALGKFLKTHHRSVGFTSLGSYGNRLVYGVDEEWEDKR